jgi:hypothetical protein
MQHMLFIVHLRWLHASTIICCIYCKIPPDDGQLIYSKHVEDDYRNELREKSTSCWSLLRKYNTMHGPQNVKFNALYFE